MIAYYIKILTLLLHFIVVCRKNMLNSQFYKILSQTILYSNVPCIFECVSVTKVARRNVTHCCEFVTCSSK